MWEYSLYHSKFDSAGNASHRDMPQHEVVPGPKLLQWELDEFVEDIKEIKSDWDKLVNQQHV